MVQTIILFSFGFLVLLVSARYLVDGATSLAKYFNISQWAIGMIIVGIGTSIPETAINIASASAGNFVGLGVILGSRLFNILIILGLSAIVSPLIIFREWIKRDFFINILVILFFGGILLWPVLGPTDFVGITKEEGVMLVVAFLTWLIYTIMRRPELKEKTDYKVFAFTTSLIMVLAGIIGVWLGGKWVVEGAEIIAFNFGISDYIIGLTIVGAGSSLPELTISLIAAFKKNAGLAIGNIIGSSIFGFLGILGLTALVYDLPSPTGISFDLLANLLAAILLFTVTFLGRKNILTRGEGIIFVSLYLAYLLYLVF